MNSYDVVGKSVVRNDGTDKIVFLNGVLEVITGDFSEHNKILNFYGYQRFGSKRPVTHLIGFQFITVLLLSLFSVGAP